MLLLLLLQAGLHDAVERAIAEPVAEKRAALVDKLRKEDFAAVEAAVRTRTFGKPGIALDHVVERTAKTDEGALDFHYAVHLPAAYDPAVAWPLLMTLHGSNEGHVADAGAQWIRVWRACRAAREQFILVSPTTAKDTWSSRPSHSRVLTALRQVAAEFNVDPDRVTLDGMSMGGGGTFDLLQYRPERWAAAAPRCNFAIVRRKKDGTHYAPLCENFRHLPLQWIVGAQDTIIPVAMARVVRDALVALKSPVIYREFEEGGHVWGLVPDDEVIDWLGKQRRAPYPEDVLWKTYEMAVPGAYWVEVLKRKTSSLNVTNIHLDMDGGETEQRTEVHPPILVRATRKGNAIDVTCEEVRELRIWLDDAMVDLDKPVAIKVNGKLVQEKVLKRSVEVLIEQARKRQDRGMTFSAQVDIKVP